MTLGEIGGFSCVLKALPDLGRCGHGWRCFPCRALSRLIRVLSFRLAKALGPASRPLPAHIGLPASDRLFVALPPSAECSVDG